MTSFRKGIWTDVFSLSLSRNCPDYQAAGILRWYNKFRWRPWAQLVPVKQSGNSRDPEAVGNNSHPFSAFKSKPPLHSPLTLLTWNSDLDSWLTLTEALMSSLLWPQLDSWLLVDPVQTLPAEPDDLSYMSMLWFLTGGHSPLYTIFTHSLRCWETRRCQPQVRVQTTALL